MRKKKEGCDEGLEIGEPEEERRAKAVEEKTRGEFVFALLG